MKPISAESKQSTEKGKLELIEKKVEIQKKRLEIAKEKMTLGQFALEKEKRHLDLSEMHVSIRIKELEVEKAELDMEDSLLNRRHEADRMLNDKIFCVLLSLVTTTIDKDRTILGSEPFRTPLLGGKNRDLALGKLMQLIQSL